MSAAIAGRLAALDPAMLHVIAASIERQMQQERDGIAKRTKARKAATTLSETDDD